MNSWPHPSPRPVIQLCKWANMVPSEPLLAITQHEARQFIRRWQTTDDELPPSDLSTWRLMGRPIIIIDLPPGGSLW